MEQQFLPQDETLLSEIRNWKNIEKLCAELDDDVLKSRPFQRLKMQEYQRLFDKYKDKELTIDERALQKVLQYRSQKIEQQLYPNFWRRIVQRGIDAVTAKLGQALHGNVAPMAFDTVNISALSTNNMSTDKKDDLSDIINAQQRPEAWRVQDLGQKYKKTANEKKLGIH